VNQNNYGGGVILSGPLAGTKFLPGGVPSTYDFGDPNFLGSATAANIVGGDGARNYISLAALLVQKSIFTRTTYDVNDTLSLFAEASFAETHNRYEQSTNFQTSTSGEFTIFSGNPYIPAATQARMTSLNLSSFTLRRLHEDWPRITTATEILSKASIFVDETPSLTPTEMRARARRLKREKGLDLVVVDYLQLMQVAGTKENRATELSEISRSLKALAKELHVPVIALSQLNRGVEQRTEKKPVMSDLRESGAIEQDADLILMIYREEVYDPNTPRKGIADIIITKQRNGPTGEVHLTFLGEFTRFENLVAESYGEGVFR